MRIRPRTAVIAFTSAAALGTALATAAPASSHGWITSPPSRAANCAAGTVTGCGAIQYEPQSVEGPKGFPAAGPADGSICAGGNDRFAELDDPRGGAWPANQLTSGSTVNFTWHFTARHATTDYEYFITKQGWDPTKPLTRADLEPNPIATVDGGGKQPTGDVTHAVPLPGRTGRALILAVWNIADTGNAFYQCIDAQF